MKLRFKHQKFQADAAKAVVDVFQGQPYQSGISYLIDKGTNNSSQQDLTDTLNDTGFKNAKVVLDDAHVLNNIQQIQRANLIKPSDCLEGTYNLTVEMETGVGKTYTYIKTMYELNKHYGWSKFIIVVPSIAIREGVYKSFQITQDHFAEEYGKKIRFFIYNSAHLNQIDQFASDNNINVMIINSQAFNAKGKDARRIDMKLDEFRSRKPRDILAKTNPILIIDEPQSVEGDATKEGLKKFNPLMTLRYSATHRKDRIFNMVYRLDAMEAYNKKLVKKIAVKGISVSGQSGTNGYLYLANLNLSNTKAPTASLEFKIAGTSIRKTKIVNEGFNLYEHSGNLEEYKGYTVSRIDGRDNTVEFKNGIKISVGQVLGGTEDSDQIRRIQIRETIESHLERERQLFYKGIKVLSLFFIDEVVKYKDYAQSDEKGLYAHMFEEEYQNILDHYMGELGDNEYIKYLRSISAHETHAGYFSIDKKSKHFIDGKIDKKEQSSTDTDAYDLIMKNKERLLDRKEPVRFIFSHSALKEGWDNPNVFQICTLKKSGAEVRKRQEVGRGLRIAVNQNGERMDTSVLGEDVHNINILTVIANESYNDFAKGLQKELAEIITDRPKKVSVSLFNGKTLKDKDGNVQTIDENLATSIYEGLICNGYIKAGELTDKYYEDKKNGTLVMPDEVKDSSDGVVRILDMIYDVKGMMPEDARKNDVNIKVNERALEKQEFINLWKRINIKSIYAVDFEGKELVEKSVDALNRNLRVSSIRIEIKTGTMKSIKSKQDLFDGIAFETKANQVKTEKITAVGTSIKYDLIGKLVDETGLTRETITHILKGINKEVFEQFQTNPEEFILKAGNLINEQKATLIIQHISYSRIEDSEDKEYNTKIFTEPTLKGRFGFNAIATEKHIYDHLLYDSEIEKDFAEALEQAQNVVVYAKLPRGFYISTPVGKYNPDWAIAFDQEEIKHVYFVAETKGNMSSLELRDIEKAKIACAKKHFFAISNNEVKYDVVSNYKELMEKVMK
ncbi:MAG: DEAD/DEAH box helicase family protein [Alphaproteobacteria bacterium]|nr:DEAD/DEAH box helicase family protein [Alphaproteobacteria bacterium]